MASRIQVRQVFDSVKKRCYKAAEEHLTAQLQGVMAALHDYAVDEQQKAGFSDMTGNWINSFGVALYRDGRCVAIANMSNEVGSPIRTTLINDDVFQAGSQRFDGSIQQKEFVVGYDPKKMGSSSQYFSDEAVLQWLSRTWTKSKGFSYRIVSVTEYHRPEARYALLRLSDELENKGGNILQFSIQ